MVALVEQLPYILHLGSEFVIDESGVVVMRGEQCGVWSRHNQGIILLSGSPSAFLLFLFPFLLHRFPCLCGSNGGLVAHPAVAS